MSNSPSVSVIVPTYNRAHLIERAISSVLGQSYADLECIVVDDGSTDDTGAVVGSLRDERVRYLRIDANRGGGFARNTGIGLARGRFIAFQDSDNEWFPRKLEKQVRLLEATPAEVGVVYTGGWKVNGEVRSYLPNRAAAQAEGKIHRPLLWENFIDTPALLVRRECFDAVGTFDERLPRFQDWDLALRLSARYLFRYIDEPLYAGFYQQDSISANTEAAVAALDIIFTKYFDEISPDRKLLGHYHHWLGLVRLEHGTRSKAVRALRQAVGTDPCCLKYLVSLVLGSLSPRTLVGLVAWNQRRKTRSSNRPCFKGDEAL